MDTQFDIDPALVAEFIDESLDMLGEVDNLFVQLETSPADLTLVESIFRPVHSIKGNSSFFGFVRVKGLSHEMETLLDLVRKNSLAISQPLIDVLLEGVDALRHILERCRKSQPEVIDADAFTALVDRVKAQASGGDLDLGAACVHLGQRIGELKAVLESGGTIRVEDLDALIASVTNMAPPEEDPGTDGARHPWPEPLRKMMALLSDPPEDLLGQDETSAVRAYIASLVSCATGREISSALDELLETFDMFVDSVGFDALLHEIVCGKIRELDGPNAWKTVVTEAVEEESRQESPVPSEGTDASKAPVETQKTMRVSEAQIDTFLSYVGELLVVGDMFSHLQKRVGKQINDWGFLAAFKLANNTFSVLSDDLQESIMSIRKISMGTLLQKVPRIIRDIASKAEKKIGIDISGDDILVDKSLMDLLDAPITHMVRNAADHGIEKPEQREAAGKPARGEIVVAVVEDDSNIVLTVKDDGAGLDYDAIQSKAESLGLAPPGKKLTQEEVVDFLFTSGVSTAAEVTDVSGRGVGMDVVKRMIVEAGGIIDVSSVAGQGSEFRLSLPKSVTTQIMQGFLVESGQQAYVLPMNKVENTSQIEDSLVTTVAGKGKCLMRNERIFPLVSLNSALGNGSSNGTAEAENVIVTVTSREGLYAMSVDRVLGVQKVVFREINGLDTHSQSISGGALMGDGSVALILDVNRIYTEYFGTEELARSASPAT